MALSSWDSMPKILLLHLHALAILASLARLFYRARTCRLWWDDFWAFVALLCDGSLVVVFATRQAQETNIHTLNIFRWISLVAFTSALWAARLSIAISIVRLVPLGPGLHMAKLVALLFVLMWAGLLTQKLFMCGGHSLATHIANCQLPKETGIMELCTDLAADLWLICSPAYLLWDTKLTKRRQVVVFSVFASNIFLSIASVAHSILIFKKNLFWISVTAHVEVPISLLICNLLVLVTWIYSRFFPIDTDEDSYHHNSSQYPTARITHHLAVPNYGFTGSALMLTEISMSLFATFERSPSHPTLRFIRIRPRSRTLDNPDPNVPAITRANTIHLHLSRLRAIHSCPGVMQHPPRALARFGYKMALCDNTTTIHTNVNTEFPSLSFSCSHTDEWDPMRCETHTMRERRELRRLYREQQALALENRRKMGAPHVG